MARRWAPCALAPGPAPRTGGRRARRLVASLIVVVAVPGAACGLSTSGPNASGAKATVVHVTVTPAGCPPEPGQVPAGLVEVVATNLDAPTVSEVEIRTEDMAQVLGEKENLIEGLSATFTARLPQGDYIVNCPGAAQGHWRLVASSRPKATAP